MRRACVVMGITGSFELLLYGGPLLFITGLLLSGRFIGEERILARRAAPAPRPRPPDPLLKPVAVMEKLDRPVEREGLKITEQVPDGEAGSFLTFKAFQTYRYGERVRWTGAPEAEHPAPRVKLLAPATAARRTAGA